MQSNFCPKLCRSTLWIAISAALLVAPLAAQPVSTEADKPAAASDVQRVDTITVTGTKRAEAKQDAAQSIEVFREADVRSAFDAFDVLSKAANVSTSTRSALPTVRGLDGNGVAFAGGGAVSGGRPRFTTYVDGVPRAYSFSVDGSASLWDMQQIEVYRGSQSTTLGRNAIAGAMVITTRDPIMKNEFAVEAGLRTARTTWSTAAMANLALGEQCAVRLTGEGIHGENSRTTSGPELVGISSSQLERMDFERFRIKALCTPTALPDLTLRLSHEREKTAAPSPVDIVTLRNFSRRESDPLYYAFFIKHNETTSLQAAYVINNVWTADAILSEQHSQNRSPSPVPGSPSFLNVFANSRERTFEPKVSYRATSGRTSAVVGAFFFSRNRIEGGTPGSGFAYDAVDTATTQSVYGDVRWQLSEKWDLLGGARWERENQKRKFDAALGIGLNFDETAKVFLPKAGAEYHLSRDVSMGGLLYKGYNAGGGGVSFYSFTPYLFRKEFADTAELFYRSQWFNKTLTVNANLFYSRLKDVQLSGAGPEGLDDAIYINAKKAHTSGVELEAAWNPKSALSMNVGVGLLHTRIDNFGDAVNNANNGREFATSPKLTLRLGARWKAPLGTLFGIDVQHTAKAFSDYTNLAEGRVGAYTLVGLTASQNIGQVQLSAFVNNLFDRTSLTSVDPSYGYANIVSPRTVGLRAKLSF